MKKIKLGYMIISAVFVFKNGKKDFTKLNSDKIFKKISKKIHSIKMNDCSKIEAYFEEAGESYDE